MGRKSVSDQGVMFQTGQHMAFFDNVLAFTILIILGLAIFGAVLRARRRDICLKSFSGYMVYTRLKSGKQIWGELTTEPTGIEMRYRADHPDVQGHVESSYIIFAAEYPNIYLIIRFLDELTEHNAERRQKTLDRSYKPNIFRRARRKIRNWFNMIRDAVSQAFTSIITAATKTAPTAVAGQQKSAIGSGKELVEWFGNAYDPILETHIGRRIVVEITSPEGEVIEYVGVFREYSGDYLEVMDVKFTEDGKSRMVDLIVPRKHGVIRHDAEPVGENSIHAGDPAPALLKDESEPEVEVKV